VIGLSLLSATGTTTTNSIGSSSEAPDEHPVNISFSDSEEPVRRSGRQRKPPVWMSSGTYELSKSVVKNPASSVNLLPMTILKKNRNTKTYKMIKIQTITYSP
jgi:hypothetical protein